MMRPSEEGFDSLGDGYLDDEDDGEEGYWDDEYNASEDFFASEEMGEVFFAYNKYEQHYTMYEEPEFDGKYTDEIKEMSADEWESIRQYNEQFPADSETKNAESLYTPTPTASLGRSAAPVLSKLAKKERKVPSA